MGSKQLPSEPSGFSLTPETIKSIVAPVAAKIIKRNLRLHLDIQGAGKSDAAAEDVYQTILLQLHVQITESHSKGEEVHDPHDLVAVIAHNVCNDIFRKRRLEWKRTKDWLRYFIKKHQNLDIWKSDNGVLCGFKAWKNRRQNTTSLNLTKPSFREENIEKIKAEMFGDVHPKNTTRPFLIEQILLWVGSPILFDDLVDFVIHLTEVREITEEQLTPESLLEHQHFAYAIDDLLDRNQQMLRIWRLGIQHLPLDQRRAFFLTVEDEHGYSLLEGLTKGIITPDEIVDGLEFSEQQLAELWPKLPLDMKVAAISLKQNQSLIKQWRSRARKKMAELMHATKKSALKFLEIDT